MLLASEAIGLEKALQPSIRPGEDVGRQEGEGVGVRRPRSRIQRVIDVGAGLCLHESD